MKGCHEGSYFHTTIVDEIFSVVQELGEHCTITNDLPNYPTEEVWFQLAFQIFKLKNSRNLKVSNTICHMPWERSLVWSVEDIEDAIERDSLPANKYSIKRIERDITCPERMYISNKFNY